tara:strand:+ start:373 stop:816 length:444 start_codon:yes stop_codon:yes gene_type:complete
MVNKQMIFHASGVDSSSVTSHDAGTDIDLGMFMSGNITSIMGEEDFIYIYFKESTRFEPGMLTSTTEQDSDDTTAMVNHFETMEQCYVRLGVTEGNEFSVMQKLCDAIARPEVETLVFDAVGSTWPVTGLTSIQIRRQLTLHSIASD